jgi:hypothetical protein
VCECVCSSIAVENFPVPRERFWLAGSEPSAVVTWVAECPVVDVPDPYGGQGLRELRLRQAWLAAQRGEPHVHKYSNLLLQELNDQVSYGLPLISDADKGPFTYGVVLVCGVKGAHGSLSCTTTYQAPITNR